MRKLILIAALVLVSASAQAGVSRGLTLASSDGPAATDQQKPAETKYAARPKAATATARPPAADAAKRVADRDIRMLSGARPRHRHGWLEARVISGLHRHGIYW